MQSGYIYLINAQGTDRYKIGLTTRTPEARLKELNGKQSPFPLLLKYSVKVSDVHSSETAIHQDCKRYHYHNEWFHFPGDSVGVAIASMKKAAKSRINSPTFNYLPSGYGGFSFFVFLSGCILFLSLGWVANNPYNPKYNNCVFHGGGAACEKVKRN
ncbi:MAG: GIY-YIG nuclease family protein [Cyanomargarita calcarea GSE-NOS-MK-12-04C]|jgi:hypothetical protein|uniref:GIY-YIG nuclease family protein n=1 Tax=Cyanomargarita calcarea GSE-NOS-MK-12-04C TaxID=2839659 RepID=A0A951QK89_9CYAN|nr:GIY-YIG nuclease family protein [Cyanomargarita calcarea GSE-NOS-MK-12-04C]